MFKKNVWLSLSLLLVQTGVNCMKPSSRPKYDGIWDVFKNTEYTDAEQARAEGVRSAASNWDINQFADGHTFDCGDTPLHCAILCEQPMVVEALLARGADINLLNKATQKDALEYAKYISQMQFCNSTAIFKIIKTLEKNKQLQIRRQRKGAKSGVSAGAYAGSGASVYTGAACGSSADVYAPAPIKKPVLPEPAIKPVSPTIVTPEVTVLPSPKIESVKPVSPVLGVSENTLRRRRQRKAAKIRQQAQVVKIAQVASKP